MVQMCNLGKDAEMEKIFSTRTSFLASSPFLILLGYFEIVDAAFLEDKGHKKWLLLLNNAEMKKNKIQLNTAHWSKNNDEL